MLNYAHTLAPDELTNAGSADARKEQSGVYRRQNTASGSILRFTSLLHKKPERNPVNDIQSELSLAFASMLNSPFEEVRAQAKAEMAKIGL